MLDILDVANLVIEHLIAQNKIYQRVILVEIYMPLKLNMMCNALTVMHMGIWKGFVESLLHIIDGKITNSISHKESIRYKEEIIMKIKE